MTDKVRPNCPKCDEPIPASVAAVVLGALGGKTSRRSFTEEEHAALMDARQRAFKADRECSRKVCG